MIFIPPLEISAKTMTLIEDATKFLIIVSPYVELSKWEKMNKCLERAKKRGIEITLFSRTGTNCNFQPFLKLGVDPIFIDNLHAKIYLTESNGIVTSQNLYQYSDNNSIDIGYITETVAEREQLVNFIDKYLLSKHAIDLKEDKKPPIIADKKAAHIDLSLLRINIENNFPETHFTQTSTYLFSGNLLKFGDVMLSEDYVIKFKKSLSHSGEILAALKDVGRFYNDQINTEVQNSHKSYYYVSFTPLQTITPEDLISRYVSITNLILKYNFKYAASTLRLQNGF